MVLWILLPRTRTPPPPILFIPFAATGWDWLEGSKSVALRLTGRLGRLHHSSPPVYGSRRHAPTAASGRHRRPRSSLTDARSGYYSWNLVILASLGSLRAILEVPSVSLVLNYRLRSLRSVAGFSFLLQTLLFLLLTKGWSMEDPHSQKRRQCKVLFSLTEQELNF